MGPKCLEHEIVKQQHSQSRQGGGMAQGKLATLLKACLRPGWVVQEWFTSRVGARTIRRSEVPVKVLHGQSEFAGQLAAGILTLGDYAATRVDEEAAQG